MLDTKIMFAIDLTNFFVCKNSKKKIKKDKETYIKDVQREEKAMNQKTKEFLRI